MRVGFEDPHGFARLDQEGFIVFKIQEGQDNGVKTSPVPGRFAKATVNDELVRVFTVVRVKIVAEHAQGRFLVPALAVKVAAPGGFDRTGHAAPDLKVFQDFLFSGHGSPPGGIDFYQWIG
jgi:hypothetical protein